MSPDDYCQQKAAASGSSNYYSFLFLPPPRRRAITALYAYCGEIDAAVDEASEPAVAAAKLDWWQAEIERLCDGQPQHPVTRALALHRDAFGLDRERLLLVLAGARMDLAQNRFLDFAALARYCHLVAGVPGELAAGVLGVSDEATYAYARQLGLALQLVKIVRDVGADARRGRIYLPLEDLQRHGVKVSDILAGRSVPGLVPVLHQQAARARGAFGQALAALPGADRRAQRPGLIMAAIYASLLEELAREDFPVLHQHVSLTPLRMFAIAWRTWVFGAPRGLGRAAP